MSRIDAAFRELRDARRTGLITYTTAGDPDLERSGEILLRLDRAGADILEVGVPFSDPLADGPVIHAAGTEALAAGVTPDDVLGVCEVAAARLPVVLMVYANVILHAGAEVYARRAAAAGAAGLIVPDLSHEEAGELRDACDAAEIELVGLVAPATSEARLAQIGAQARGFVYAVSLAGTTGERSELAPELAGLVARTRASTANPVAVGFGISTPAQARAVGELADGVIVGSRVVRAAGEGGARAVGALVAELAAALA
ncbi:MAG: tryptophan synthase subunit alpha [Thermoleophilaceae bacterium]